MLITPENTPHIHLVGVCGTAMGNVAVALKQRGFRVTGSDTGVYPPMSDVLQAHGIPLSSFDRTNTAAPDLFVMGNAIPRGNPEAEEILTKRLPCRSLPEVIRDVFVGDRKLVLVTGTHGKTSTTAMIAHILQASDVPVSYLFGGVMVGGSTGFNWDPDSRIFVLEGDEYDTAFFDKTSKFLKFSPDILVINALEFDHGDIFRDLEDIRRAFRFLLRRTPETALVIANGSDSEVDALEQHAYSRWQRFGDSSCDRDCSARIRQTAPCDGKLSIEAVCNGQMYHWCWSLPGLHNARNGLAAALAAIELGIDAKLAFHQLDSFPGVVRRFQLRHHDGRRDIRVIEDFAHHPTAIGETIRGARELFPESRIVAVVEPATNTLRSGLLSVELSAAMSLADLGVLLPKPQTKRHAQTENAVSTPMDQVSNQVLQLTDLDDFEDRLSGLIKEGDVLLFMSNGTFQGALTGTIERLRKEDPDAN